MSAAFIVECSITMAWCFADEATPAASKIQDRLKKETVLVPAHWFLEVTNVLAMAESISASPWPDRPGFSLS